MYGHEVIFARQDRQIGHTNLTVGKPFVEGGIVGGGAAPGAEGIELHAGLGDLGRFVTVNGDRGPGVIPGAVASFESLARRGNRYGGSDVGEGCGTVLRSVVHVRVPTPVQGL